MADASDSARLRAIRLRRAYSGPIMGHAVGPTNTNFYGFPAAAEVAAPHPGTCWVMTKIVVHYHVGLRHYSASDPYQLAVCSDAAQPTSAMSAPGAATSDGSAS